MEDEQIKIEDESGDHRYFTMIPNYVLNHSTAIAQALYLQLKRLAGENGKAYPANGYLMRKLGISRPTLNKEIKYLLEKGWIKYNGLESVETDGGAQKIKSYKIVDLWKMNADYYEPKGGKNSIDLTQRGVKIDEQGVKARGVKIDDKEEPVKEEPSFKKIATQSVATKEVQDFIFSFKEVNPSYKRFFSNRTERAAADRLLKEHGVEKMKEIMIALPTLITRPYYPKPTSPYQLERELGKLIAMSRQDANINQSKKQKVFNFT